MDLTGKTFGRWAVISKLEGRPVYWLCRCECGAEKRVRNDHLKTGMSRSCGCFHSEQSSARAWKLHQANTKTGLSHSPTYSVWSNLKQRCENRSNKFYSYYGGRGIKVCERWQAFENFLADMGLQPPGLTIDRINTNGYYEPGNCRWVTRKEQQNNLRSNRLIDFNGEPVTLAQLSEATGIHHNTLAGRIDKGWPMDRVLSKEKQTNLAGLALGGLANGERNRNKTHCPHGHPYSGHNLTINPKTGGRVCKACRAIKERRRRESKKEESILI